MNESDRNAAATSAVSITEAGGTEAVDTDAEGTEAEGTSEPVELELGLVVTDREVIGALGAIGDPLERSDYALAALRLGILALRTASSEIDARKLRREGERMVEGIERSLVTYASNFQSELRQALKDYFDPGSGRFALRVDQLVGDKGDLSNLLAAKLTGEHSELAETLARHVGETSPLLRRLDPEHAQGVIRQIEARLRETLAIERQAVLEQFSLDREDSALARLVRQITDQQGRLRQDLASDYTKMVAQFSLDDESSALSRLVRQVDRAQRGIVEQFSLDDEGSALSRLRSELAKSIAELSSEQRKFQTAVLESLSALAVRRELEKKSTVHGLHFEERLCELLVRETARTGDLVEACGQAPGLLRNCKVGDVVVELGPEQAGAGAKIVFEAKEAQRYDDRKILEELILARQNRGAEVGVFVLSRKAAGDREVFRRIGTDLVVVWDAEDPQADIYVQAALSVAKALVFRVGQPSEAKKVDFGAIEKAVVEIMRQIEKLDTIQKAGETIKSSAQKILDEARKMREALTKKSGELETHVKKLRAALSKADGRRDPTRQLALLAGADDAT